MPLTEGTGMKSRQIPECRDHKVKQIFKWSRGDLKYLRSLLDDYGPVLKIDLGNPTPLFVFADPQYSKEFFSQPKDAIGNKADGFLALLGEKSLFGLSGEEHLQMKRIVADAFHTGELSHQIAQTEDVMLREIDSWPENKIHQTRSLFMRLYRKTMQEILWGSDRVSLTNHLVEIIEELLEYNTHQSATLRTMALDPRSIVNKRYSEKMVAEMHSEFEKVMEVVMADPTRSERKDVMSILTSLTDSDGNKLTHQELRDQMMSLTTAGHETTATETSWLLDMLAHNGDVQQKIYDGDDELGLRAIKETMRLRPVVPNVLKQAKKDLQIVDVEIPKRSLVIVSIWLTHMNPDIYESPDQFNPDRWLNPPDNNYAWIPFSAGLHRCIGARLATEQMQIVMKTVLDKYEILPVHKSEKQINKAIISAPKYGGEVFLRVR